MRRCFLGLVLTGFIVATLARHQRDVEHHKPAKFQSGLITIKQTKPYEIVAHHHRPRGSRQLRKTVVKITQTSPMATPATPIKSQLAAVPFQNEYASAPITNTANAGGLSYQYTPGSFLYNPTVVVDYDHKQQKYTYRPHQPPATFQPSTPLFYTDYDTGIHFQNPYLQTTGYMTPPSTEMYAYAPAYMPATTTTPKKTSKSSITKARTVPVAIYYAEEPYPANEEPLTTLTPIKFTYPKKKLRVRKVPVKQSVSSPPTVTYHSYKMPLTYTTAQEQQQQVQQPFAQNLYSTLPQFSLYKQPVAAPPTVASTPYYHNTATVYSNPFQTYNTVAASTGGGSLSLGKVANTKLRPSGLGISYSPVGPGVASYNFQGFGVEYGY